jgi:hypothetical protein
LDGERHGATSVSGQQMENSVKVGSRERGKEGKKKEREKKELRNIEEDGYF